MDSEYVHAACLSFRALENAQKKEPNSLVLLSPVRIHSLARWHPCTKSSNQLAGIFLARAYVEILKCGLVDRGSFHCLNFFDDSSDGMRQLAGIHAVIQPPGIFLARATVDNPKWDLVDFSSPYRPTFFARLV